jgi:hypothetical protein
MNRPDRMYRPQVTEYLHAGARQFGFMVRGLRLLEPKLNALNIPLFLLKGARRAAAGVGTQRALPSIPSSSCAQVQPKRQQQTGRSCTVALLPDVLPGPACSQVAPSQYLNPTYHRYQPCPPAFHPAGDPTETIPKLTRDTGASLLVTDFACLRLGRQWREEVAKRVEVPFHEVDAHNVVPVWVASGEPTSRRVQGHVTAIPRWLP